MAAKLLKNLSNFGVLSEYVINLPIKPKPVLAEFYASNKEKISDQVKGLNGSQTLLKVVEIYKKISENERENLRESHRNAFKMYQEQMLKVMRQLPPEIKSKIIMNGLISNPYKIFDFKLPTVPKSAYSYYTQKILKNRSHDQKISGINMIKEVAESWNNLSDADRQNYINEWNNMKSGHADNLEGWKLKMLESGYPSNLVDILSSKKKVRQLARIAGERFKKSRTLTATQSSDVGAEVNRHDREKLKDGATEPLRRKAGRPTKIEEVGELLEELGYGDILKEIERDGRIMKKKSSIKVSDKSDKQQIHPKDDSSLS